MSTRVTGLTFDFGLAFGKMLRQRRPAWGQVGGEAGGRRGSASTVEAAGQASELRGAGG